MIFKITLVDLHFLLKSENSLFKIVKVFKLKLKFALDQIDEVETCLV